MNDKKGASYNNNTSRNVRPPAKAGSIPIIILIFTMLLLAAIPVFSQNSQRSVPQNAQGTYIISTAAELADFRDMVNSGTTAANAELAADIDLGGGNWQPIGTGTSIYTGTFNGRGHSIVNFNVTSSDAVSYDPTQTTANLEISRTKLVSGTPELTSSDFVVLSSGYDYSCAGLFGVVKGTVSNLYVFGELLMDFSNATSDFYGIAGGVVGYADTGAEIDNCRFDGTVRVTAAAGFSTAGGIVGYSGGEVKNCLNMGAVQTVSGDYGYCGGIAGQNWGTVTNCSSSAPAAASTLDGSYGYAGGIAGFNYASVIDAASQTAVTSTGSSACSAGGIVGYNYETITNAASAGIITAETSFRPHNGGVAGIDLGTITNCSYLAGTAQDFWGYGSGTKPAYTPFASTDAVVTAALPSQLTVRVAEKDSKTIGIMTAPTNASLSQYAAQLAAVPETAAIATAAVSGDSAAVTGRTAGVTPIALSLTFTPTSFTNGKTALSTALAYDVEVSVLPYTIPAAGLTLNETSLTLNQGGSATLTAALTPSDTTESLGTIIWNTSDATIATAENGKISAISPGSAIITAQANGFTAQCAVTVAKNPNPSPSPIPPQTGSSSGGCNANSASILLTCLFLPIISLRRFLSKHYR